MTPEEVLSCPPRVLTQAQREFYFENGYVNAGKVVPDVWLSRLQAAMAELIARSRSLAASDRVFDLEKGHSSETPRLRRVTNTSDAHPTFWEYISQSLVADLAADLVGPNVKFMDSNLNFKWAGGGTEVKWHQDAQYTPHTNYSQVTIATMLDDVELEQGAMGVIPGSHEGELFSLYDDSGMWTGTISDEDMKRVALDTAVYLTGVAGTIHAHNCRTIHGSARNDSPRGRPLLLTTYVSADAFAYAPHGHPHPHLYEVVRGEPARWSHHDPRPNIMPPDWSKGRGYGSIFAWQQGERRKNENTLVTNQ
jgi:hypothetical protein